MIRYDSAKDFYDKGINFLKKDDYESARYWFNRVYQGSGKYSGIALIKLAKIDIIEGKYAWARNLLETGITNDLFFKQIYGLLENIENNFERSKKYYEECMVNPKFQNVSLLELAKLNMQLGDYSDAKEKLGILQENEDFFVQSTITLVCLSILEKDYEKAYQYLKQIDVTKMTKKLFHQYEKLDRYILSCLKKNMASSDDTLNSLSDETLLKHLNKHKNPDDRMTYGCFFQSLDLKKLLMDARDKIENMNPNHFEASDMYRFRLDNPIGFKGEEKTNDLCVVTMLGTKDVITMYPVLLSNEFDKEDNSYSKELARKREQGFK